MLDAGRREERRAVLCKRRGFPLACRKRASGVRPQWRRAMAQPAVFPAGLLRPVLKAGRGRIKRYRQRIGGSLSGDEMLLIHPRAGPRDGDLGLYLALACRGDTRRGCDHRFRTEYRSGNALTVAPPAHHHPVLAEFRRGHWRKGCVRRIRLIEQPGIFLHGDARGCSHGNGQQSARSAHRLPKTSGTGSSSPRARPILPIGVGITTHSLPSLAHSC